MYENRTSHFRITINKNEGIYMITGGNIHWIFSRLNSSPQCSFQKIYFKPNWIRRGATEVCVMTPKVAVPKVVPGLANCGWLRAL